jgi:hypothetical protein
MKWESRLEMLAARARAEETPHVNVAPDVLSILMGGQAEPLTVAESLWMWLAAGASALAVPAAVIAVTMYNAGTGPLREIVNSVAWAM